MVCLDREHRRRILVIAFVSLYVLKATRVLLLLYP